MTESRSGDLLANCRSSNSINLAIIARRSFRRFGHPRIVFISELLHHPLKVNSSSLNLIVN